MINSTGKQQGLYVVEELDPRTSGRGGGSGGPSPEKVCRYEQSETLYYTTYEILNFIKAYQCRL